MFLVSGSEARSSLGSQNFAILNIVAVEQFREIGGLGETTGKLPLKRGVHGEASILDRDRYTVIFATSRESDKVTTGFEDVFC